MRRKRGIQFLWVLFFALAAICISHAQSDTLSGEISYKTSQNIYVRFSSTQGIQIGDTLYAVANGSLRPVLSVRHLSSTSCVGIPLDTMPLEMGLKIFALKKKEEALPQETPQGVETSEPPPLIIPEEEIHPDEEQEAKKAKKTDNVTGRLSTAAYVYFGVDDRYNNIRMRHTLSMNVKQIGKSRVSAESYLSFRHTLGEWQEVKDDFGRAFKVYNLALKYAAGESASLWIGRKINYNLSNVGAIDGIQFEKNFKKIFTGIFAGSRPNPADYGFNFDMKQFGAYAGNKWEFKKGSIQNTLAFAEQRNGAMTDRRFGYIQHMNSAINRINIFTSFEFDLYTLENGEPKNTFRVTSIYASIRYRPFDKLSLFGSYDARNNIIYYETYKNFIDQLLEDETRQGLRFNFNYRPFKKIAIGTSAGYRYQKDHPGSKNLHSYVTYSRIPKINASATASFVWIQSPFLDGLIYGVRLSKDLINGKLFAEAEYRQVSYTYTSIETPLIQSIASLNLSWRASKKVYLSVNYEGEIQQQKVSNRIYANATYRF